MKLVLDKQGNARYCPGGSPVPFNHNELIYNPNFFFLIFGEVLLINSSWPVALRSWLEVDLLYLYHEYLGGFAADFGL